MPQGGQLKAASSRVSSHRGKRLARRPALVLLVAVSLGGATFFAPTIAPAAECAGDECQPPALPPEDPVPGTAIVNGPPNPPVHYPKVRKHHHAKKHRHTRQHRGSR